MPTRRSILAAVAGGTLTLGGCLVREPKEPPRNVITENNETETERTLAPISIRKPEIVGQELVSGPDGDVIIEAELENVSPSRVDGTLYANVQYQGTAFQYGTEFDLSAFATETVSLQLPIEYESFASRPSLRLSVVLNSPTGTP
ncbi:MAG: hypothetical protein V5A34_09695 [Halapricum sp.]